jgi:hypothetical protein
MTALLWAVLRTLDGGVPAPPPPKPPVVLTDADREVLEELSLDR